MGSIHWCGASWVNILSGHEKGFLTYAVAEFGWRRTSFSGECQPLLLITRFCWINGRRNNYWLFDYVLIGGSSSEIDWYFAHPSSPAVLFDPLSLASSHSSLHSWPAPGLRARKYFGYLNSSQMNTEFTDSLRSKWEYWPESLTESGCCSAGQKPSKINIYLARHVGRRGRWYDDLILSMTICCQQDRHLQAMGRAKELKYYMSIINYFHDLESLSRFSLNFLSSGGWRSLF